MSVELQRTNPDDGAGWLAHWEVFNTVAREVGGASAAQKDPAEAARAAVSTPHRRHAWFNALLDGEVVGVAHGRTMLDAEPVNGYVDVGVLPSHRGHGVGRLLAEAIMDALRRHGVRRIDCWPAELPGLTDASPARALAASLGMALNAVDVVREAPLPPVGPDGGPLPLDPPPGYRFEVVRGQPSSALYPDLRVLLQAMETDVPQGQNSLPRRAWGDEAVRARFDGGDELLWLLVARDGAGGVAGFTELANQPSQPDRLQQGDTLVLEPHRGHGLGYAMKAAAMARACRDAPWMTVAQTSNDETNRHMVAINERLGFRPVARVENWTWLA